MVSRLKKLKYFLCRAKGLARDFNTRFKVSRVELYFTFIFVLIAFQFAMLLNLILRTV
jgi:hypothetical protein